MKYPAVFVTTTLVGLVVSFVSMGGVIIPISGEIHRLHNYASSMYKLLRPNLKRDTVHTEFTAETSTVIDTSIHSQFHMNTSSSCSCWSWDDSYDRIIRMHPEKSNGKENYTSGYNNSYYDSTTASRLGEVSIEERMQSWTKSKIDSCTKVIGREQITQQLYPLLLSFSCYFDATRSTEQLYRSDIVSFHGPYASLRAMLDYTYHANYTPSRQALQDWIITTLLQSHSSDPNVAGQTTSCVVSHYHHQQQQQPHQPWIVFTAGAMGAGKSYTIRHLTQQGRFPLQHFVSVDPDEVRRYLPEFSWYIHRGSSTTAQLAGELTRKEAGYISELITLAALEEGKNVLVDGSLRDAAWYQVYFQRLREMYGGAGSSGGGSRSSSRNGSTEGLRIGILHVTAPREAVWQRAEVCNILVSVEYYCTRAAPPPTRLEETEHLIYLFFVPLSCVLSFQRVDRKQRVESYHGKPSNIPLKRYHTRSDSLHR